MQGERASVGSLSESLNFKNGSSSTNPVVVDQQICWENFEDVGDNDLHNYMNSAADANTTFANSVYPEQRFSLGEASSSSTKNEAPSFTERWMGIRLEKQRNELNPLFMQPSSANRVVRNVNLNLEHDEHLDDMNPVTGHPSHSQVPENGVRVVSSVDGRRKRKALDSDIGQSSSHGGFREFHHGESSSWVTANNDLNISLNHGPRGLVPDTVPNLSAIPESSSRNFSDRVNPTAQQETVNPAVFAAGTVIRQRVVSAPGHLPPVDQQRMDLRYRHAFGNYTPLNPNASNASMPSFAAAGGSSSSAAPVDRNVVETRPRSDMLANPLFVPPPRMRNVSGPGQVASSSSRTSALPSPPNPALTSYQTNLAHNRRRLSEHLRRRSMLSSLATNQRGASRSPAPPASLDQHVLQSGSDTTFQAQDRDFLRTVGRQGQTTNGAPQPLQGLSSTSRRRGRLEELSNVLNHMRRTGTLRMEDVMLLNESMLGAAGIHDRYRDMRLDVDNMSYEELLSLGERIGDVCTGLNEETISNRLKQQKYSSDRRCPKELEPCCICQEEYNEGEEMGMLECGHGFHSQCIKEWLKLKNLCPICKTTGLNTAEKK